MKLPWRTTRATPVARNSRVAVVISSSGSAPALIVSRAVVLARSESRRPTPGDVWARAVRRRGDVAAAIATAPRVNTNRMGGTGIIMGELLRQALHLAAGLLPVGRRSSGLGPRAAPAAPPGSRRST